MFMSMCSALAAASAAHAVSSFVILLRFADVRCVPSGLDPTLAGLDPSLLGAH